jgi:hypothetical protein
MRSGVAITIACVFGLLSVALTGCADDVALASRGDELQSGVAVSIDLDGDGTREDILFDRSAAGLTITDGPDVYRNREQWRVVAASLADSDGNGLPEIVTLLDDPDGRHLGLFGYAADQSGGKYRELIVTAEMQPKPVTLRVVVASSESPDGDQLVLTEKTSSGTGETTYRWNGFGFTAQD